MPIIWAVDGLPSVEISSGAEFVEVPIGVHERQIDGRTVGTCPDLDQKTKIIKTKLIEALATGNRDYRTTKVAIVDEVQQGGTIGASSTAVRRVIDRLGLGREVHIYAAQDSRKRVKAQPKTASYRAMASNSVADIFTTVVPLPLLATDKDPMLDTIILEGDGNYEGRLSERLTVVRNTDSEQLFRTLGSLARSQELRHDEEFVWQFLNRQPLTSTKAANLIETWIKRTIQALDEFTIKSAPTLANNIKIG
jgi:hypothetical protein